MYMHIRHARFIYGLPVLAYILVIQNCLTCDLLNETIQTNRYLRFTCIGVVDIEKLMPHIHEKFPHRWDATIHQRVNF